MTKLENNVKAFIFKYENENEIELLPLCVLSSNLHRDFKHFREVYNDFNKLNDEEQKQVLKYFNVDFECSLKGNWINEGIKIIVDFIKENNLHNDNQKYLSFNLEKYFDLSLKEYSDCKFDKFSDKYDKFINAFSNLIQQNENMISFEIYFEQYMITQIERDDKLVSNVTPPIQYVVEKENLLQSNDEKIKCLRALKILEIISIYIKNRNSSTSFNEVKINDLLINTYEDEYYYVLLFIYQIVKLKP